MSIESLMKANGIKDLKRRGAGQSSGGSLEIPNSQNDEINEIKAKQEQMQADIEYIAMMTKVEL